MGSNIPTYRYRVDEDDLLVWVDEWWLAFAQENGAADLLERRVLGQPLWDFIQGDEICRLYAEIHARVRSSEKSVILPFRCDSPSLQRHMRLTIKPEESGQLLYEGLLVRAEPQRYLNVLDTQAQRSESFLAICSCCKQALLESEGWMNVEDVAVRLGLFESQQVPNLHQTICPSCMDSMSSATGNGNAA